MTVTLHGWAFSPYLRAARIALAEKGVDYAHIPLAPGDMGTPDVRAISPFGKIPVLVHDGVRLIETPAILRYVDEMFPGPSLQPEGAAARARADMLMLAAMHHVYPTGVMGVFFGDVYVRENGGTPDPVAIDAAAEAVRPGLGFLAGEIGGRFLFGDRFTTADALIGSFLMTMAMSGTGRRTLAAYPALEAYTDGVAARPSVQAVQVPVPRFGL